MRYRTYVSLALSLALIPCFVPAAAAAAADLSAEKSTLERQVSAQAIYYQDATLLGKKATLTVTEVDALSSRAESIKSAVPGAQSAIASAVRKLKASGEFATLDASLTKKITDSRKRSALLSTSYSAFLDQAGSTLSGSTSGIGAPVDKLRFKLSGATGSGPVPTGSVYENVCNSAKALVGVMIQAGWEVTPGQWDTFSCACSYAAGNFNSVGLGTARSCDESMMPLI